MKHLKNDRLYIYIYLPLAVLLFAVRLPAQQPAHNRFQYHRYTWRALHNEMFHLYFPEGYDSLCRFASVHLPDIAATARQTAGMSLNRVPNIIIYPSADQLYESNIGLYDNTIQTFPTVNLKGSRVVLAFSGSYEDFRMALTEAWIRLLWEDVFRADMGEQLTGRETLMPSWFKEGCIRYFTEGWPVTSEDRVMRYWAGGKPDSLVQSDPALYGQAFCYFLSMRYRKDAARQIVAQMRQGKSLSRAARLVAKQPLDTLKRQCAAFYRQRAAVYLQEHPADSIFPTAGIISRKLSPDGRNMVFVTDDGLKRSVYLTRMHAGSTGKISRLLSYSLPPWIDNHKKDIYPIVSWEDNSRHVLIVLPERGKIRVKRFTSGGILSDARTLYGVEGVSALYGGQAGGQWIMAAFRKGQGDIVLYHPGKSGFTPLTNDLADNTGLAVSKAGSRLSIAYRSGYPADSIMIRDTLAKDYGIYEKPIDNTAMAAAQPEALLARDSAHVTWTSPAYDTDSRLTAVHTAAGTGIREILPVVAAEGRESMPWLNDHIRLKREQDSIALLKQKLQEDNVSLLADILEPGGDRAEMRDRQADSVRRSLAYTGKKVKPYILQLYSAYFSASINNDYYINRYQPYRAYLGSFKFPEVGAMVQGGFSDLFDNHYFNIGYRMPSGTDGSDFFFRYENTARKLDWHILYFRKVESLQPDPDRNWTDRQGRPYPALAKVKTYYYELGFRYPLHYHWTLSLDIAARNDKTIFPATDGYSLRHDNLKQWWNINTLALHADRLYPTIPMLYKGWKGSVVADGMISDGERPVLLYGSIIRLAYHQPLYKKITAVLQLQAGHSGGEQKILYNFGGLDNNVVPRTDTSVQFKQDAPYAFQSLITPFRGYKQNSIYGSSFGLINADIYVPLFTELIPWHTAFNMLNQLQLGVFCDAALTRRSEHILPPAPSALYAYGFSARTMLAGYGLRFDMAWPGRLSRSPVWYLSLIL